MICIKCSQDKDDFIVCEYGCICKLCYIEKFKLDWAKIPLSKQLMNVANKMPNLPHTSDALGLKVWEEMKKKYEASRKEAAP